MAAPEKIRIRHEDSDDSRFNAVGRVKKDLFGGHRQFMAFVTGAYPGEPDSGLNFADPTDPDWYGVIHLFDERGEHLETLVERGGTEADGKRESCERAFQAINQRLLGLGKLTFCDIEVGLFRIDIDGYVFGLEYSPGEDGPDDGYVMLWPNDVMFHPPWDGEYST